MPGYNFSITTFPLLLAAVLSGGVAIYAWRRRQAHSAIALTLLAVAITEWLLGYAFEIAAVDLSVKILWGKLEYIGIATTPVAWLVFTIRHAWRGKRPTWWAMVGTLVIPVMTILIAFTNETNGLLWKDVGLYQTSAYTALSVTHGQWFWVHSVYSYFLLLVGSVLVFRMLARREGLYRGQAVALLVAALAPWVSNMLYLSGASPFHDLDLTPFAFAITVLSLAWAIFGYQLINLSPLARDFLVDQMTDGVIVIDSRGRVVDTNPAAARMVGISKTYVIGKQVDEIFAPWPDVIEQLRLGIDTQVALSIGKGNSGLTYSLRISRIQDNQGRSVGRILTLTGDRPETVTPPQYALSSPEFVNAPGNAPVEGRKSFLSNFQWLVDYFLVRPLREVPVVEGTSPLWLQARERSFTIIVRLGSMLGTLAFLVAPAFSSFKASWPFAIILMFLWSLALFRRVSYAVRTPVFLTLVYLLAFSEVYSFGYSVESFTFFTTLVITAVLLHGRTGGLVVFGISLMTLAVFGVQIGRGAFVPPNAVIILNTPQAVTALLIFFASSSALITSVLILMGSLNKAWQRETQALNLLQQERDLLEQHVEERTRDLEAANAETVASNDTLRRYFRAIEYAGSTVVITDANGNIEYANPIFTRLTGYNRDEVVGKNPRILQSGQHNPEFYQKMWNTIKSGRVWKGEFLNRKKDGSLFWESATIAPVPNHLGEITHFVASKVDITAQKELQSQLMSQNKQMASEINERIRVEVALEQARDQAVEANQVKSQLLSQVNHELRTPLGAILGFAELLRSGMFGPLEEPQQEAVGQIVDSSNYLTGIVNELLDAAQIEAHKLVLRVEPCDLRQIVNQVSTRMSVLAQDKGLMFSVDVDPALPELLLGDERRLNQILINLIGNAVKFTRAGSVQVKIVCTDDAHWMIQVSDTGVGIPKEAQEYIFEPFRQVVSSSTRDQRGTGLGLSITRQLVGLMGGEISVESVVGQGSTFSVKLPLHIPSPEGHNPTQSNSMDRGSDE